MIPFKCVSSGLGHVFYDDVITMHQWCNGKPRRLHSPLGVRFLVALYAMSFEFFCSVLRPKRTTILSSSSTLLDLPETLQE